MEADEGVLSASVARKSSADSEGKTAGHHWLRVALLAGRIGGAVYFDEHRAADGIPH
jgi:hypothetical protein